MLWGPLDGPQKQIVYLCIDKIKEPEKVHLYSFLDSFFSFLFFSRLGLGGAVIIVCVCEEKSGN